MSFPVSEAERGGMEIPELGSAERRSFSVTEDMVAGFARLSGDGNSLHMDPDFGRRSMFRGNIVHGMLPVLYLCALRLARPRQGSAWLRRLAARFLKPVFPGDSVFLEARVTGVLGDGVELDFRLANALTGTEYATGTVELAYRLREDRVNAGNPAQSGLVLDPLEEVARLFDEIGKGEKAGFHFQALPDHARQLEALLAAGLAEAGDWEGGWEPGNWLGATLLSTLVGMRLPGRYATFMDFQIEFSTSLELCKTYYLEGEVRFKSATTETLVEQVSITGQDGRVVANGRLNARVNEPPARMPGILELKREALDLGLEGRVALITGASRGIGETIAKLLALHGAKVVVNYRSSRTEAEQVVEEILTAGGTAIAVQADVADRAQVERMVELVRQEFGPVDVLVNSAVRSFTPARFLELTWQEMQRDLDVVLAGAFHCCQAVLPGMVEQGGGKIINLSTIAVEAPPVGQTSYVVAKSGLVGLTRSLAVEFARDNIQVNLVAPSMVETDLTRGIAKMFRQGMKNDTPLGRNASSVDVARAVLFLASSLASFTTGQTIMVTGGQEPFL